eukprot:TRINITY_DN759_c0_g1_i1.p1 TRINITY_DN759_c0_g1~~TRINITY_DN759_c0_g1_i1.p1  ORF type:complete len:387 (-),score=92.96 TRINITY_DN759_c0_g1_i1:141-1301(-)
MTVEVNWDRYRLINDVNHYYVFDIFVNSIIQITDIESLIFGKTNDSISYLLDSKSKKYLLICQCDKGLLCLSIELENHNLSCNFVQFCVTNENIPHIDHFVLTSTSILGYSFSIKSVIVHKLKKTNQNDFSSESAFDFFNPADIYEFTKQMTMDEDKAHMCFEESWFKDGDECHKFKKKISFRGEYLNQFPDLSTIDCESICHETFFLKNAKLATVFGECFYCLEDKLPKFPFRISKTNSSLIIVSDFNCQVILIQKIKKKRQLLYVLPEKNRNPIKKLNIKNVHEIRMLFADNYAKREEKDVSSDYEIILDQFTDYSDFESNYNDSNYFKTDEDESNLNVFDKLDDKAIMFFNNFHNSFGNWHLIMDHINDKLDRCLEQLCNYRD